MNPLPGDTTSRGSRHRSQEGRGSGDSQRNGIAGAQPAGMARLRRGHSDGGLLGAAPDSRAGSGQSQSATDAADRETMLEFLHHSANTLEEDRTESLARLARREGNLLQAQERLRRRVEGREHMRRMTAPPLSSSRPDRDLHREGTLHEPTNTAGSRSALDRPLPPPPGRIPSRGSQSRSEYQVPHWQPDQDVSTCPVCRIPFSFLRRKHHCRKCGRVVCGACSPHRITIPQQYVVRPPEQQHAMRAIIDLTGNDDQILGEGQSQPIRAMLGPAEEVRLCNPCVPDPNPMPHGFGTAGHDTPSRVQAGIEPSSIFPDHPHSTTQQDSTISTALPNHPLPGPVRLFPRGRQYIDPRTLETLSSPPSQAFARRTPSSPHLFSPPANVSGQRRAAPGPVHTSTLTSADNVGIFPSYFHGCVLTAL